VLEALSLLLLRSDLGEGPEAELIEPEELEKASNSVKDLLSTFLRVAPGGNGGQDAASLTTREFTLWKALERSLLVEKSEIRRQLKGALDWLAEPRRTLRDPRAVFLRKLQAIVANDLHSWFARLRGSL
jgi:hypothetical protein